MQNNIPTKNKPKVYCGDDVCDLCMDRYPVLEAMRRGKMRQKLKRKQKKLDQIWSQLYPDKKERKTQKKNLAKKENICNSSDEAKSEDDEEYYENGVYCLCGEEVQNPYKF